MSDANAGKPTLFTIGHSDHSIEEFLSLLATHGVTMIADVRSSPYSKLHGQFNRETLATVLQRASVQYLFLGKELGARRDERECYRDQQARYDLIIGLAAFQKGLDRVRDDVKTDRVCLLCAEKDPLTCHRTILVCRQLRGDPFQIQHILEDGSLESTQQAEQRLLSITGLPAVDLFRSQAEMIEQAYDIQAERIAYIESEPIADGAWR